MIYIRVIMHHTCMHVVCRACMQNMNICCILQYLYLNVVIIIRLNPLNVLSGGNYSLHCFPLQILPFNVGQILILPILSVVQLFCYRLNSRGALTKVLPRTSNGYSPQWENLKRPSRFKLIHALTVEMRQWRNTTPLSPSPDSAPLGSLFEF